MTRLVLGACLASFPLLAACTTDPGASPRSHSGDEPACADATGTELGVPFGTRVAYFRTSGGQLRIGVSDLGENLFGVVTLTRVDLGSAPRPRVDPASNRVLNATTSVTVHLDRTTDVSLPAGEYWLASSNGGRIVLHTCPDVRISDVRTATGEPGAAFGSGSPG